jgi:hypothetical protein
MNRKFFWFRLRGYHSAFLASPQKPVQVSAKKLSALAFVIQFSMASLFFEVVGSCELSRVASHP